MTTGCIGRRGRKVAINARSAAAAGKPFPTYLGSKEAAGSFQQLIRIFPPHSVYVDAFLGNSATARHKTPALRTIGIDKDPRVIEAWRRTKWPGIELVQADALEWLEEARSWLPADALVYADPTYPHETRGSKRYRHELSADDHARLLTVLDSLPCSVVVSSYDNRLYRERLKKWQHHSWRAMTRGGVRTEHAWVKTAAAAASVSVSVEPRYVGHNFRDRLRIKRKVARWALKFQKCPARDRIAILSALLARFGGPEASSVNSGATAAPAIGEVLSVRSDAGAHRSGERRGQRQS